jgi:hypothetical protein
MLLNKLKKATAALLVVLALLVATGAIISRTPAGEPPEKGKAEKAEAKAKIRWEYKALTPDYIKALEEFKKRGTGTVEGGLNLLGDDGWELVTVEPAVVVPPSLGGGRPALYVFKRQKQ